MERFKRAAAQAFEHAANHRRGGGIRWKVLRPEEIRAIREGLHLTQLEFSRRYGFGLESVKSWELGRSVPDQGNSFILALIEDDPPLLEKLVDKIRLQQSLDITSSRDNLKLSKHRDMPA